MNTYNNNGDRRENRAVFDPNSDLSFTADYTGSSTVLGESDAVKLCIRCRCLCLFQFIANLFIDKLLTYLEFLDGRARIAYLNDGVS